MTAKTPRHHEGPAVASSRKAKGAAELLYGSRCSGPIKRDWDRASAMLDLRAVYINGDSEAFQQHRIKQERRRLYPYRSFVQRKRRTAA